MIKEILRQQREYFNTQETKPVSFRRAVLKKLRTEITLASGKNSISRLNRLEA